MTPELALAMCCHDDTRADIDRETVVNSDQLNDDVSEVTHDKAAEPDNLRVDKDLLSSSKNLTLLLLNQMLAEIISIWD